MNLDWKKGLSIIFVILAATGHTAGADETSIFVSDHILVCPIGWESEEEIRRAYDNLEIEIAETIESENNEWVLLSPIEGRVLVTDTSLILENDQYRIVYPSGIGILVSETSTVDVGDPLFVINDCRDDAFLFLLRSSESPFDYIEFHDGEFVVKVSGNAKVFSLSSGRVFLFAVPSGSMKHVSMTGDVDASYFGVGDLLVEDRSYVHKGEQLGTAGNGLNNNFFELQLTFGLGPLNPYIIYIEVLER